MDERITMILPAWQIPEGSTVTKRTGEVEYLLRPEIKVYSKKGVTQVIKAGGGVLFLVGSDGNANAISADTKLAWSPYIDEAIYFLEEEMQDQK